MGLPFIDLETYFAPNYAMTPAWGRADLSFVGVESSMSKSHQKLDINSGKLMTYNRLY